MFKADTTLSSNPHLISQLVNAGWRYEEVYSTEKRTEHKPYLVGIFSREIRNPKKAENVTDLKSVTTVRPVKPIKSGVADGVENQYGMQKKELTPCFQPPALCDILSIRRMQQDGNALVLALDTEFCYSEGARSIITWQIAFIAPARPEYIQELIFVSTSKKRVTLEFILSYIFDSFDFSALFPNFKPNDYRAARSYVYHTLNKNGVLIAHTAPTAEEAYAKSALEEEKAALMKCKNRKAKNNAFKEDGTPFIDRNKIVEGYISDFSLLRESSIPLCLVCHAGKADLTALDVKDIDVLPRLADVQGGLVSLQRFALHTSSLQQYWKCYAIVMSIRDTMCFAPAGQKSLAALGKTIDVPKLDVSEKNDMLGYLCKDPVSFFEYAINDSVITLCFAGELWGYNTPMPVTVSGAAAKATEPVICEYLGINADDSKKAREAYNRAFCGLRIEKKGLIEMPDKAGYYQNTALVPVSDNARILQTYAQQAYKGGYNGSIIIGKYDGILTHDYDLESAYPTCMALVPDVDWESPNLIVSFYHNEELLDLEFFHTPFDLMFGYVKFKFPKSVKFPCIPVSVNGSMIFPRSSDGLNGVYASAPEIYLALCLGAEVRAVNVYVGKRLRRPDGTVSHSLLAAVKQFVNDRILAQQLFGKKSLPDLLLKTAVNSLYGKTAQDLIDKETWNAFHDRMDNIGGSVLTSPTHACLTTAGVRCVLLAAMNELHSLGYKTYSVTTDGFITDAPEDVLNSLSLFGFSALFRSARQALVGSEEMWAEKHHQTDLLNFTTRGNVSLSAEGVCAHNSFVTGYEKDSYEDRLALMTVVLGREGRCHCKNNTWTKFRKLAARQEREDFAVTEQSRALSMDFDLKRKPLKSSMETVFPVVEGEQFEILNFDTDTYKTIAEYEQYKAAAKSCSCLRTQKDWDLFFAKAERTDNGGIRQIKDLDWSILFTCIMGYRLKLWDIPYLNTEGLTVEEKIKWINTFNKSKKKFCESDWKNCRKQNRQSQMLERNLIEDTLTAMQNFQK